VTPPLQNLAETELPERAEGSTRSYAVSKAGNASLPGLFLMTNSFETGGSERQFVALAQSLDPSAFRVDLGCIQNIGRLRDGLGNISEFGLGGSLYKLESLKARWRLSQHLRKHGIAIAQAFDFYTNLTLIPAARMARVPVVIGSHRQLGDLLTPSQFRAQAAAFRLCDRVVCNSRAAAQSLLKQGISERKVVVIGNGLPESAFAKPEPAMPRIPGKLRIGVIARMNTRYKNHEMFLRAAAQLSARFPNVEFALVGEGPFRPELEAQAQNLGIQYRVRFLGDRRDIPALLASFDVSVVPSSSESLSNVILESMAAGVPVVAARVGGNLELLSDDRGILYPASDESALLDCLGRLVADEALRVRISDKARPFVQANFTIEQVAKQYEDLYVELLARSNWRRKTFEVVN
jgi:L-malate glycosyltransferase